MFLLFVFVINSINYLINSYTLINTFNCFFFILNFFFALCFYGQLASFIDNLF